MVTVASHVMSTVFFEKKGSLNLFPGPRTISVWLATFDKIKLKLKRYIYITN